MLSLYAYAGYNYKLVQYSCQYKDKYTLQLFTLRNTYLKGAIKFSQIHPFLGLNVHLHFVFTSIASRSLNLRMLTIQKPRYEKNIKFCSSSRVFLIAFPPFSFFFSLSAAGSILPVLADNGAVWATKFKVSKCRDKKGRTKIYISVLPCAQA